jgi:uncharacterized membrane protein YidH (DUF202 family)
VAFDETKDAARRTRLANERTYLAWWRTGLTSIAVCIGLGRIVPGVTNVTKWPYELVGAGYGVLGVGFMILAHVRVRAVEAAVDRGEFERLPVGGRPARRRDDPRRRRDRARRLRALRRGLPRRSGRACGGAACRARQDAPAQPARPSAMPASSSSNSSRTTVAGLGRKELSLSSATSRPTPARTDRFTGAIADSTAYAESAAQNPATLPAVPVSGVKRKLGLPCGTKSTRPAARKRLPSGSTTRASTPCSKKCVDAPLLSKSAISSNVYGRLVNDLPLAVNVSCSTT